METILFGALVFGAVLIYVFFSIRAILRFMRREDARGEAMNRAIRESQRSSDPDRLELVVSDDVDPDGGS